MTDRMAKHVSNNDAWQGCYSRNNVRPLHGCNRRFDCVDIQSSHPRSYGCREYANLAHIQSYGDICFKQNMNENPTLSLTDHFRHQLKYNKPVGLLQSRCHYLLHSNRLCRIPYWGDRSSTFLRDLPILPLPSHFTLLSRSLPSLLVPLRNEHTLSVHL